MNILWLIMICASLIFAFFNGRVDVINQVCLNIGKDTFDFVLPLVCTVCFWNGVLYVAREAGMIAALEKVFHPFLKWLLPDLKEDEETLGYVATNITVNMFGLGSAATPVGLKAMEGMQPHNPKKDTASRSMVTFLVLNTAGVTLLPTTLIALRSEFHSLQVTDFMPWAVLCTMFASLVGIAVDRWWNHRD